MKDFETSLLREKFVIHDPKANQSSNKKTVVALSNRMVVELKNNKGSTQEIFIIRAQNMHCCARFAAKIISSFRQGPLMERPTPYDWDSAWSSVLDEYEYNFNPQRWIAIYKNGKPVFEHGDRHPLLDLIEKCDAENDGTYDEAAVIAEGAFKKTGKPVKIEYDGNVALVVNLDRKEGRCAVILRGADKTTTFNFSVEAPKDKTLNFAQCMTVAAAFLEGVQLSFMVGMNNIKIRYGVIERHSRDEKQNNEAKKRLGRLGAEISNLENAFKVRYRPERPEFQQIIVDAEELAEQTFEPPNDGSFIK